MLTIIYKILVFIIFLLDRIEYKSATNKMVDSIYIEDDIKISTDTGFKPISNIYMTKPFVQYTIKLDNGYHLTCADNHILFNENYKEIFTKELNIGSKIITDRGISTVTNIIIENTPICMFDVTVQDDNHRFWSNGILSHNSTTTGIFCLWKILFHPDTNGLVLSKSGAAGQDLIKKIKDMYLYLPYYLKAGTMKWNQSSFSFDNNSSISTEAFSPTAGLGQTINMLILDEFAWCPSGDVDLFYENVIPTVTTMPNSTVAIMSTQNGFNLFYKLWKNAIEKKSVYVPYKIDWQQVPQYNIETKQWEKRTEEWHKMMVGILGSEESFQYQYGTQFSASDKCIISREKLSKIRDKAILFENSSKFELLEGLKLMTNGTLFIKPDYDVMKFKTGYFLILQDLAEGGGADYTVFNIFEISFLNGKPIFNQVAFWRSNEVKLEIAALDFWLLVAQLFTQENILVSIEWNTYGALYLKELINYNETGLSADNYKWRFNIGTEFEYTNLVQYKKGSIEDAIAIRGGYKNSKTIPGIRWNAESKKTACSMTKIMLENDEIIITDLINIGELENFEDKNGTGSYKASYGHDDMMMTIIQIPMVLQTAKWINFKEEVQEKLMLNDNQVMHTNNIYDMPV